MNLRITCFILVCLLIVLSLNFNPTSSSHPFQEFQTQNMTSLHTFKNHKKATISQKEKFQIHDFITSLNQFAKTILNFLQGTFEYFMLTKEQKITKQSVFYRENFASENGGAQLLMVSSSKIKSPKAILKNDPDAYLFTADVLPITIIVGLKEQILIDSFVIQSGEEYSCIVQDFMIEGAFSLEKQEWILLGNFTAQNSFEAQQFAVSQRIIRYLRLTILSSYGKWKYFTLTQIRVYGQGLFSHAMQSLLQADYNIEKNHTIEQGHSLNDTKRKKHHDKFANKQIHTKQILVEAFTEVAGEKQVSKIVQENKEGKQRDVHHSQQARVNESHSGEKTHTKEKKSISNLKKKINYLEKRNYELHKEVKELRKITGEKLAELESKHHQKSNHRQHHHQRHWYEFLFDSHSIIYLSMFINISCLVLVGLVLKHKIFQKEKDPSSQGLKESRSSFSKSSKDTKQKQKNSESKDSKKFINQSYQKIKTK